MAIHELINWQDGILRDVPWLKSQSGIYAQCRVDPRTSVYLPGDVSLSIAEGEGRGGRNALRIRCAKTGVLPDFLLFRANAGNNTSKYPSAAYLIPPHIRANRLHMWVKYPSGYRAQQSQQTESGTVEDTYNIGTYHWDPAMSPANGTGIPVNESNGWHGYFQFAVRHDLADGNWVHICVASHGITHKRNEGRPAANFTQGYGETLETLTRVYFAPYKYGFDGKPGEASTGSAEISAPYDVLIDSIYVDWVDEYTPIEIQIENWQTGQWVDFVANQPTPVYHVTMKNTTAETVSGYVALRYWRNIGVASLLDASGTNVNNTTVTFAPNETKQLRLSWGANTGYDNTATGKHEWHVSVQGADGGTWRIIYGGEATAPLSHDPTIADVQAALDALSTTAAGELVVSSQFDTKYPFNIYRTKNIAKPLIVDDSGLTGPSPRVVVQYEWEIPISVSFIPSTEETRPRYGANQVVNKSDPNVTYRQDAHLYMGPIDADICNFVFHARFVNKLPLSMRASSLGLQKWTCYKNTPLTRKLPVHDPQGQPCDVRLIDWEARERKETGKHILSGGGSLAVSNDGLVTFNPLPNFIGTVTFRYVVHNALSASPIVYSSFINVIENRRAARTAGDNMLLTTDGKLVMIAN